MTTAEPEIPEPAVETPDAQPESDESLQAEPVSESLPRGADAALPAVHQTKIDTIATLPLENGEVVVYSFNQLAEFMGTRAPELRKEIEAARQELLRECEADRGALRADEREELQRNEPGCDAVASANAAGLPDASVRCERIALAQFDAEGTMVAQKTLADLPCRTGAVAAELRDFSGHGKPELVLFAEVGSYGSTPQGYGLHEDHKRILALHLKFRDDAFVSLLELDLSRRDLSTANPSTTERRVRVSPRWLEIFTAETDGGCGVEGPAEDEEAGEDEEADEDDEDEDPQSCVTFTAERLRWDHFEGRYVEDKPVVMDAAEIEQSLAALPAVP